MKKIFLLLLAVIIIGLGAKLALEAYYENKLDELITQTSYYADVNYRKVSIGFDSSISINDLTIQVHSLNKQVRAKSITLNSSDRFLPLRANSIFETDKTPEMISLSLQQFEYDIAQFNPKINPDTECKYLETTVNHNSIGISRITSDIDVSFDFRNSKNGVISIASDDQTASMNATLIMDANLFDNPAALQNSQPISELTLDYRLTKEVANNVINYCSQKLNLSNTDYLTNVVSTPQYTSFTGIDLGTEAQTAIVDIIKGGISLSINSKPSKQLKNFQSFKLFSPENVIKLLNLTVLVDTKPIRLRPTALVSNGQLDNTADESKQPNIVTNDTTVTRDTTKLTENELRIEQKLRDIERAADTTSQFRNTAVKSASNYLNSSVMVSRSGTKKQITGILTDVIDNELYVETKQYGGLTTFRIPFKDIVTLNVYR